MEWPGQKHPYIYKVQDGGGESKVIGTDDTGGKVLDITLPGGGRVYNCVKLGCKMECRPIIKSWTLWHARWAGPRETMVPP
jgi:hypothetical protein